MSSFEIRRPHQKTQAEARQLAEAVAQAMQREFGMKYAWQQDDLCFSRPGVSGMLSVPPGEIVVSVQLGLLLASIQPKVVAEINRFLDQSFASPVA